MSSVLTWCVVRWWDPISKPRQEMALLLHTYTCPTKSVPTIPWKTEKSTCTPRYFTKHGWDTFNSLHVQQTIPMDVVLMLLWKLYFAIIIIHLYISVIFSYLNFFCPTKLFFFWPAAQRGSSRTHHSNFPSWFVIHVCMEIYFSACCLASFSFSQNASSSSPSKNTRRRTCIQQELVLTRITLVTVAQCTVNQADRLWPLL